MSPTYTTAQSVFKFDTSKIYHGPYLTGVIPDQPIAPPLLAALLVSVWPPLSLPDFSPVNESADFSPPGVEYFSSVLRISPSV